MNTKHTNTGFTLLVTVFTAICLFAFASIILASVKQNTKQLELYESKQTEYYDAVNRAENAIVNDLMTDGEYSHIFIINENSNLYIAYTVTDKEYTITSWKIIDTSEWAPGSNHYLWK